MQARGAGTQRSSNPLESRAGSHEARSYRRLCEEYDHEHDASDYRVHFVSIGRSSSRGAACARRLFAGGHGVASRARRLSLPDHDGERGRAGLFRSGHSPALRLQPRRSRALFPPRRGARPASADAVLGARAVDRAELQRHGRRRGARASDLRRRQNAAASRTNASARERDYIAALAQRYPSPEPSGGLARLPPRLQPSDARDGREVSRRPRRRHDVRREPHDAAAVAALDARRRARARHARARRGARVRAAAQPESSGRESLLHPRGRGVAQSRARDPERDAA